MKKRCLNRRGFFFLVDSMLALGILAVGVFLIFALYAESPSIKESTILSDDVMDFFATNKIKDINNEYAGVGGQLWDEGKITNPENTLLQQIAEFYENDDVGTATTFIEVLTKDVLPPQYDFEVWLYDLKNIDDLEDYEDKLLYPATEKETSKKATKVLIPSKKIVYGFSDIENGIMFGPYTIEVLVWQ